MQKTGLKKRDMMCKDLGTSQQGSEILLSCPGDSGPDGHGGFTLSLFDFDLFLEVNENYSQTTMVSL